MLTKFWPLLTPNQKCQFPVINSTDGHAQRYRNRRKNNQHVLNLHYLEQLLEVGLLNTHYFRLRTRAASFYLTSHTEHFSACSHALDEAKSAGQCRVSAVQSFSAGFRGKNERCKCASCWPFPSSPSLLPLQTFCPLGDKILSRSQASCPKEK